MASFKYINTVLTIMEKIGVCGLACFKCTKYSECGGCKPNEFCPLPACATDKGLNLCFECKEFPCEKVYEKGPFVKELVDHFKA
ncbi:DUF3795 domain-containing protein [Candidatus Woesearchaeota archaeon]|nr:DUF3795 domain-containing protein [Candidatus Woesearchaeota archaeon]